MNLPQWRSPRGCAELTLATLVLLALLVAGCQEASSPSAQTPLALTPSNAVGVVLTPSPALRGRVVNDLNGNGVLEPDEPGLSGWRGSLMVSRDHGVIVDTDA